MDLRQALHQVDLFRALPESALDDLMQSGTTFKLPAGRAIVEQGAPGGGFQLIRTGSAVVSIDGFERVTLGEGQYFGEMSLIDNAPRSATVLAGPDGVTTFALSPLNFSALMDRHPQVARALLPVLTARIRAAESAHRPAGQ